MEGFVGLRCNARVVSRERLRLRTLRGSASHTVLALAATALLTSGAWGDVDSGTTVTASSLSGSGTTLAGGTYLAPRVLPLLAALGANR